jgi:uncharacterized membrane protein YkvA (DUF1232 family)
MLLAGAARFVDGAGSVPAALESVRSEVATGVDLLGCWHRGEYPGISRASLVLLAGALLYLIAPLDLVPDFVPVSGLLDDAAVIAAAMSRIQNELEQFRAWRSSGAGRQAPGG